MARSTGSGHDARWRVFISHTVELRNFPQKKSYIAEVERAISAAGHVIVDMADFPATDQPPARLCEERVRSCEVYLGILGTRYGSPVRGKADVSYTELEFDTATDAGLDRLVFLLDTEAEDVGIPASSLIDREYGARQDAFRKRVQDSGLTTQSFASPATLGRLVERSLRDLADTRKRIESGIQREQVPAELQPVRETKFVNPPPAIAPTWFRGRQAETRLLGRHLADPGIRLVTVAGRAGIGKTALVCRLLKGLEAGRVPGVDGDPGALTVAGIVYLSSNGAHQVTYPTLVADLLRLLPWDNAERLQGLYQNPQRKPTQMMLALLEDFPVGKPVVVLLDNLESVMDTERETLTEPGLHEALSTVLTAPAHAVTVIATTRVLPTAFLTVEPARQRQLRLEEGLGSPDAENVLRELDDDGRLGLRDAPGELLDGLRRHTLGVPRALEAVKAILDGDATLTPQDLLDRTRRLPQDQVTQVLVGEAYDLLDPAAQQVMQALSVYPAPVSEVGVDYLLRPFNPTIDAAPILARLVRRQLVRYQDHRYDLHPLDREYARSELPTGDSGDPPTTFTLTGLQARAADYYTQIRTPRSSWRNLEDVQPQLAEFELRCDTGDFDSAATVLEDIEYNYLQVWGHYRKIIDLRDRIHGHLTDSNLNQTHLINLGICHYRIGNYQQAINLQTQALLIAQNEGNRDDEGTALNNLGLCYRTLGEFQRAIDLYSERLTIARETGNRYGESNALGNLGECHADLGDYQQAVSLSTNALEINRNLDDRMGECVQLANLGAINFDLGDYRQAVEWETRALEAARKIGFRYMEASALCYLSRAWLALGDVNQAITLSGQAAAIADLSGDIEPSVEARSWLARSRLLLGDATGALDTLTDRREFQYPMGEPSLRLLEGLALLELHRADESVQTLGEALRSSEALLALAERNVAALQVRALALSGLAAAAGDRAKAIEAAEAFARALTVTDAAGVVADTRRLFEIIARHDDAGVLAGIEPG